MLNFHLQPARKEEWQRSALLQPADGETATYNMTIEVRSPNPPETRSEFKFLRKGEKWETSFRPVGIAGSNSSIT